MLVVLFVASQDLVDGLLRGDFNDRGMIRKHVDQLHFPAFLGQLADDIVLVLPPLDFIVGFELEVLATWAIVLGFARGGVNFGPGLPGIGIEPKSDVSTGSIDKWPGLLLYNDP